MYKKLFLFALLPVLWSSCIKQSNTDLEVQGFVPEYLPVNQAKQISYSSTPRSFSSAGKIVAFGSTVFQIENGAGIHIINYSNPSSPVKAGFIAIPGCVEMSIKNNTIYANNFNDLVVLDVTAGAVTLLKRVDNAFPRSLNSYPPGFNVYFECPESSKGYIVSWKPALLKNPKCRR
jgi:hypothetical protein